MKIKIFLGILLTLLLVTGSGCVKQEGENPVITGGVESGERDAEPVIKKEVESSDLITERTKGLDIGQESYFYYKIDANKGMKVSANSENIFSVEVMSDENCKKKTKNEDYTVEIEKKDIRDFEFESEDVDEKDKQWCVVVANSGDKYNSVSMKIEGLNYK